MILFPFDILANPHNTPWSTVFMSPRISTCDSQFPSSQSSSSHRLLFLFPSTSCCSSSIPLCHNGMWQQTDRPVTGLPPSPSQPARPQHREDKQAGTRTIRFPPPKNFGGAMLCGPALYWSPESHFVCLHTCLLAWITSSPISVQINFQLILMWSQELTHTFRAGLHQVLYQIYINKQRPTSPTYDQNVVDGVEEKHPFNRQKTRAICLDWIYARQREIERGREWGKEQQRVRRRWREIHPLVFWCKCGQQW